MTGGCFCATHVGNRERVGGRVAAGGVIPPVITSRVDSRDTYEVQAQLAFSICQLWMIQANQANAVQPCSTGYEHGAADYRIIEIFSSYIKLSTTRDDSRLPLYAHRPWVIMMTVPK